MQLYDQLGSKARAAISNAHRALNVASIVREFKTNRHPSEWDNKIDGFPPLDLQHPDTDARLAVFIGSIVRSDSGKSVDELTLRPRKLVRRIFR